MHELAFNAINCWRPTALFSLIFNEAVQLELKDIKSNLPVCGWLVVGTADTATRNSGTMVRRLFFTTYFYKIFTFYLSFLFSLFITLYG
jgi:hypothetical protein